MHAIDPVSPATSTAHRQGRGRFGLAVLAAYVLVTVVMTWPYVNYADLAGATYGGDQRLIIWTLAWDNHALLSLDALFDANVFYPARDALRYNEHLFGLSLFTLPWTLAGASPVLAHRIVWGLAFLLNGLAAFALVNRFVRSPPAAFVGSLAFAYSFYVMLHAHGHLHQIWLWPIPVSLLLLERWFDGPSATRMAAWTAVVLVEALTSWYLAVFILLANALFGAVLALSPTSSPGHTGIPAAWRRRLVHLACAAGILVLGVYPFATHYRDLASTETEIAAFSADAAAYLVPPANTVVGRWWQAHVNDAPRSMYGEQTLSLGWLTLVLAAMGLVSLIRDGRREPRAWLFPALAVSGILLSFGPSLPVLGQSSMAPFTWLSAVPGLDGLRVPARFAAVASLGLAGLVGTAGAAILRLGRRGSLLVALAAPLMLVESFVVDFPGGKPESHPVPPIYQVPQVRSARALVSLPDYRGMPDWFLGGDYLYYSTVHWRPIVNGFGRAEPSDHARVVETVRAFPQSAPAIRALGIQYVVVHAARLPDGGRQLLEAVQGRADCRLILQIGSDYLFEIV